jgi:transcriptional regulator with XRE-family HTH domain
MLREIRGKTPLRELAESAGINHGILSAIERGRTLPSTKQLEGIEQAYGAGPEHWYPPEVLLVLQHPEPDA